jgi:hypothetical protein
MTESSTNIIVGRVDLVIRVRDAHVVKEGDGVHEGLPKVQGRFGFLGRPIVNARTPWLESKGAVEDWSRVLVRMRYIDQSIWRQVTL